MNKSIRSFFAAFAITGILIGALCGFAAVDLSTGRYMPGRFGSFFEVQSIKLDQIEFTFLAQNYTLDTFAAARAGEAARKYRGLLPILPQVVSSLAADATDMILKQIQEDK